MPDQETLAHGTPLPAQEAPARIDDYRLLRRIGEGGMGEVWLAEQTAPIRRTVALKLVKAGMDTRRVIARFESERQALAWMDHAAIARVLDAGSTSGGQPYFVMEHVDGAPITAYCDRARLTIEARLRLFVQVCEGVQHAHQKAIIHRDLKPSNVLVAASDGRPQPKIIDFGIAKARGDLLAGAESTEHGVLLGTPEYMSPEQADVVERDVDTRSDVYSLGAMLYELLTGALPFESKELRGAGLDELRRMIREVDPPAPSERVRALGAGASDAARARREETASLARALRGDLDAIVMKALEKERAQRYGSPAELAADVDRYLKCEPVIARRARPFDRAWKYARRHRAGAAVGAIVVLLTCAFTASLAVQVRRVSRERDRANREAEAAQRIADFMAGMFTVSDPSEARGSTVTAREILDRASREIEAGLARDPEVQARLMATMARVYDQLALDDAALPLAERAVAIDTARLGEDHRETLRARLTLAQVERELGRNRDAEARLRAVLDTARRTLGADDPDTLESELQLGAALEQQGRGVDAEPFLRDVFERRRRTLGADDRMTLLSMAALAITLGDQKRYDEAEQLLRGEIAIGRRTLGAEHPTTLAALHNLGSSLTRSKHYVEGEQVDREVIATSRKVLGPDHADTLGAMNNLATTLAAQKRYADAEQITGEVLAIQRRVLPASHPRLALTLYNLACLAAIQGRPADAIARLRDALDHGMSGRLAKEVAVDPDLASLRGDPAFESIAAAARAIEAK